MSNREQERLESLRGYEILDTAPSPTFDGLARLAAHVCDTPIALVSLVDQERQWFKSAIGIDATETPRDVSFCAHAVARRQPLIVPDAEQDPAFADNGLVTGDPGIRFYAGIPLMSHDDFPLGTLCVIDQRPRELDEQQLGLLHDLAGMVEVQMELFRCERRREEISQGLHDLSGPLTISTMHAELASGLAEHSEEIRSGLIQITAALDQASTLVKGLKEQVRADSHSTVQFRRLAAAAFLSDLADSVQAHARAADREILLQLTIDAEHVFGDPVLLGRATLSLVDNAIQYSPPGAEIEVAIRLTDELEITVSDRGAGIPEDEISRIFDVGVRLPEAEHVPGAGLGLAIVRRVAEMHRGKCGVRRRRYGGSAFWLRCPRKARD